MTNYKLFYLLAFFLISFSNIVAQDSSRSWSIGLNSSSVLYSEKMVQLWEEGILESYQE
jgi:hypothetical protein